MSWLVALDFGTTSTAVAVSSGGGAGRALVFGDGSSTVPSSVFAESDGRLLVGTEADNEAELRLDAYEPTPKRRAGDGQIRLGDRDFAVAEVIGAVMAAALGEAMQQNNNTVPDQVVLTHPVAWRSRRRAVLAEALSAAGTRLGVGFPDPAFVAEPVAAAQWYTHTDPPEPGSYFAVYDLGGGTFDTTVLQATGEGFEVVASGGVDPLGGFDFDAALFEYLGTKYIAPADAGLWSGLSTPGQADPELARQRRRLQQRVGLLKLGLSTSPDRQIQLPGVDGAVVVTRGEYEGLIGTQIDNTIGELEDTIADAGLTPDKLTAIYRIGGAARTPLAGAALERFRVPVKVLDQPKLVVAQGAATSPRPPTAAAKTITPPPAVKVLAAATHDDTEPASAITVSKSSEATSSAPIQQAPVQFSKHPDAAPVDERAARHQLSSGVKIVFALIVLALVATAAAVIGNNSSHGVSAPSTSKKVSKDDIVKQITTKMTDAQGNKPDSVTCPDGLKGEVGAQLNCGMKIKGQDYNVNVTATSVKGDDVEFDMAETVDKSLVASKVSEGLTQKVGQKPDSVTCPDNLKGTPGSTLRCDLKDGNQTYGVTVTVTDVDAGDVHFDFKVDDQPS